MGDSFKHATLYNYCHDLYCKHVEQLESSNIHPAIARSPANKLFYWYPATTSPLLNLYNDTDVLSEKGWIPGFYNAPFLIWYRKDHSIQCIPVDLKSAEMIKTGSLNTDYPFSYKWVKVVTSKQKATDTPVYVCGDPVIAALMIDRGELCVALGGDFLPQGHEKHLVALNRPLIYLGVRSKKDAPTKFVTTLHRYNSEAHVALVDDLREMLTLPDGDFQTTLSSATLDGTAFLIDRIATKRRASNSLTLEEEYSQLISAATPTYQERYRALIQQQSVALDSVNYANACLLMSELLRASMNFYEARDVVRERYGLNLSITNQR